MAAAAPAQVPDPTAGFGTPNAQGYLSGPQIAQWANYFASDTSPTAQVGGNQLVQTGTQFSPTIPWLTGGAQSPGMVTGQPGQTSTGLNLPWGSLGISGANPQALANSMNASPYGGANPANPYYNLIINQAAQGSQTPVYTNEPVQQTVPNPWATVQNGNLTGNYTPEELALITGSSAASNLPAMYLPSYTEQVNNLLSQTPDQWWAGIPADPVRTQNLVLNQMQYPSADTSPWYTPPGSGGYGGAGSQ